MRPGLEVLNWARRLSRQLLTPALFAVFASSGISDCQVRRFVRLKGTLGWTLEGTSGGNVVTRYLFLAVLLSALIGGVTLANELPAAKQTRLGLYLTAEEAAAFLKEAPETIIIDVRTPEEINETGIAEDIDALIPLAIFDGKKQMVANPDFQPGFRKLASIRNLSPDHPIVFICRSGNRSAHAVNTLSQLGFTNLHTITDGYEGDRATSGPTSGQRSVNGWKNAGLPWRRQDASACAPARDGGAC